MSKNNVIKLDEAKVKEMIENSEHQLDALIGLYKMVFPDWDSIEYVNGFPTINKKTNEILFALFTKFDRKHHPKVIPAGLWMNNGFSSLEGDHLQDWEVDTTNCPLTLKGDENGPY